MLYLISTPIGNLDDITLRAIKTLESSDIILCEDTRKSMVLLNHLGIKKKLVSFHKFNEKKNQDRVITELKEGKNIALISDGGTPLINDPGYSLVRCCQKNNLQYTALPGPCSIIDALVLSGLNSERFQFLGFLPKKDSQKKTTLKNVLFYQGLSIFLESPNRIIKTLQILNELDSKREIAIARELTKKHEEILKNNPENLLSHFKKNPPKGEMVLIIDKNECDFKDFDLEQLLNILITDFNMSKIEAIKTAAALTKEKKKSIYDFVNKK